MAPAFSSTKQAGVFVLLLLVILLLPVLVGKSLLPPREEIYSSTPWVFGPFHHLRDQIFRDKSDIDIAFIGSSRMWYGIDTPYVQQHLSERLGRKAVVITLGWSWAGFDALYFVTQDLLRHRKVRLIVFTEECRGGDNPHHAAPRWFRFGDNAEDLEGVPLRFQAAYYLSAIVGMPRNLLSLIRPNFSDLSPAGAATSERTLHAPDPTTTMGAISARLGLGHPNSDYRNVVDFASVSGAMPSDVCVFSPQTKAMFEFPGPAASPLQLRFARKFAALATQHQSKLVYLHLPETKEMRTSVIQEREFWPDALRANIKMVGIPPATMFASLKDEDALNLFVDPVHINQNGGEYFTRLIYPVLSDLYVAEVKY
jgi:hypothetical protein